MKYFKIFSFVIPALFLFSLLFASHNQAFAQIQTGSQTTPRVAPTINSNQSFAQLTANFVVKTGEYVIRFLVALSVFVFLYGIMKYMFKGQGSDTARTEGRKLMLWGIIGLFSITSIWGLVNIATSLIGHDINPVTPQFKIRN